MSKLRRTIFRDEWILKPEFYGIQKGKVETEAYCILCEKIIKLSNMGIMSLKSHVKPGTKHNKKMLDAKKSADMHFFTTAKNGAKQAVTKNTHEKESMDLTAEYRHLILTANKVFGESKWSHSVVNQILDFTEVTGAKCYTGCVSFVKVQLENGNFHEDIGYYSAEESTKGLSVQNARIGSAVNALRRVLLSFGDKIEKELQQLEKQIDSGQTENIQKSTIQVKNEQIPDKSNVSVTLPVSHVPQIEHTSESEPNKNIDQLIKAPSPGPSTNNTTETNHSSSTKVHFVESKKKNSIEEKLRQERKRKQMEKQMEFKRRMMEKEVSLFTNDNKPNPKY